MYWYIMYFLLGLAVLLLVFGCSAPISQPSSAGHVIESHRPDPQEPTPFAPKPFGCDARDLVNFSCE